MADHPFPVLRSGIPADFAGRRLTYHERMALQSRGVCVQPGTRVIRAHGTDHIGALYLPREGGMAAVGACVEGRLSDND